MKGQVHHHVLLMLLCMMTISLSLTFSFFFASQQKRTFNKLLIGNHRCNQYASYGFAPILVPNAEPFPYIPDSYMATCKIENLCLTSKGEFVLFEPSERIGPNVDMLNSKPWVYVQGSTVHSERGYLYMKLIDGDLMLQYEGKDVKSAYVVRSSMTSDSSSSQPEKQSLSHRLEQVSKIPIEIAKDFKLYKKPVYALKRYHAANRTHLLSETLPMIMGLMTNFRADSSQQTRLENNHILFLDNLYDTTKRNSNWLGTFHQPVEIANRESIASASLISINPILELCFKDGVWKVDKAPCENFKNFQQKPPIPAFDVAPSQTNFATTFPNTPNSNEESASTSNSMSNSSIVLQACFSNIHMGHSISNLLLYPYGKEGLFMELRELVYKNLKIFPYQSQKFKNSKELEALEFEYTLKKQIVIGIVKSNHKQNNSPTTSISNVDELVAFLQQYLSQEVFIGKQLLSNAGYKKSLQIRVLNSDDSTTDIPSLVKTITDVDVLISDPLSSIAYFSMFMRRETTMLLAPSCNSENSVMTSNAFYRLFALPNVQVMDMMELFGEKSFTVVVDSQTTTTNVNHCQIGIPKEKIFAAVVKALRKRYRKLME